MKSLIIGARGLVGTALRKYLPSALCGISVETKEKNEVYTDITKYESLFKVFSSYRPQVVYLSAAITHVDKCEDAGTNIVNVRGATTVLRLCEMFDAKLVYFSSSYVFDGKKKLPYLPQDDPNPLNNYGKQKLVMENLILQSDAPSLILRTVGVYGEERLKKNFAKQVISAVFKGQKVYAPVDQQMNPILSDDLAKVAIRLAEKHRGIWHVAGDECISKYEFARRIASYFSFENLIHGVTTSEMNQKAIRPENGCLDCSELERTNIPVPDFESGLIHFLGKEFNG